MNQFTRTQLDIIAHLARTFWDQSIGHIYNGIADDEVKVKLRDDYIKTIIEGLTDPDYWGR